MDPTEGKFKRFTEMAANILRPVKSLRAVLFKDERQQLFLALRAAAQILHTLMGKNSSSGSLTVIILATNVIDLAAREPKGSVSAYFRLFERDHLFSSRFIYTASEGKVNANRFRQTFTPVVWRNLRFEEKVSAYKQKLPQRTPRPDLPRSSPCQ